MSHLVHPDPAKNLYFIDILGPQVTESNGSIRSIGHVLEVQTDLSRSISFRYPILMHFNQIYLFPPCYYIRFACLTTTGECQIVDMFLHKQITIIKYFAHHMQSSKAHKDLKVEHTIFVLKMSQRSRLIGGMGGLGGVSVALRLLHLSHKPIYSILVINQFNSERYILIQNEICVNYSFRIVYIFHL